MVDLTGSLIVWLRAQPAMVGVNVVAQRPRTATDPTLVVRRIGGPFEWPVIDQPTISLEAYGTTQAQAWTVIQNARGLVWSQRGLIVNSITIYRIEEFSGPAWLPDPETEGTPRYVTTISVRHREPLTVA